MKRAFILAGGQSRRMGQDKALLLFKGQTLLEHALSLAVSCGFEVAAAGVRAGRARSSTALPDRFPESGPLGGIEAALSTLEGAPAQPVLFLPVDLPLLPPVFLHFLWERARLTGALATVPWCAGRAQPLCAVYQSSLLPGIRRALERGDRKVMHVVRGCAKGAGELDHFRVEAVQPVRSHDDPRWCTAAQWFTNLNTPADYERLLALDPVTRSREPRSTPDSASSI